MWNGLNGTKSNMEQVLVKSATELETGNDNGIVLFIYVHLIFFSESSRVFHFTP